MPKKSGIQEAVDMFGGSPTTLAAALGNGITRQNIEHWLKKGRVPEDKCHIFALKTGISVDRLNPLHDWAAVRQSLAIGA